jgi:hypothetical protein
MQASGARSLRAIAAGLNVRGIRTPRGVGEWQAGAWPNCLHGWWGDRGLRLGNAQPSRSSLHGESPRRWPQSPYSARDQQGGGTCPHHRGLAGVRCNFTARHCRRVEPARHPDRQRVLHMVARTGQPRIATASTADWIGGPPTTQLSTSGARLTQKARRAGWDARMARVDDAARHCDRIEPARHLDSGRPRRMAGGAGTADIGTAAGLMPANPTASLRPQTSLERQTIQ